MKEHVKTRPAPGDRKRRRSLTNVGGAITTHGDEDDAAKLAHALDVPVPDLEASRDDAPDRAHVHGFHAYPARLHPVTAARLIHAFASDAGPVLDPFCGSGTVLVESMLQGRASIGTDVNPLAVRLAACKTRPREDGELAALIDAAKASAAHADERRKARVGASQRYPDEDARLFDPHVLLELDGLRLGIAKTKDLRAKNDLELVLSAILVKVSRKTGDTSADVAPRRIAAGYTAKLFVKKAEELTRRIEAFREMLPARAPTPKLAIDDATKLRSLHDAKVGAIVTSPPYAATYDYLEHHSLRLRWLGIDASEFAKNEIGARRNYAALDPDAARDEWSRELGKVLARAARLLKKGAPVVFVMADSAVRGEAIRADEVVAEVAAKTGFVAAALASQSRPHFHGPTQRAFASRPRAEHAMLLRRS